MRDGIPQVPILGQQQQAVAQAASQMFVGMYVAFFPQLAIYRAAHGYDGEPGCGPEPATPERVAAEAASYVGAAMEQIGFKRA